jgi:hypothetical protein
MYALAHACFDAPFVAGMQVKVKPLASVKGSDRALYKLVDLAEITNPGTSPPVPSTSFDQHHLNT